MLILFYLTKFYSDILFGIDCTKFVVIYLIRNTEQILTAQAIFRAICKYVSNSQNRSSSQKTVQRYSNRELLWTCSIVINVREYIGLCFLFIANKDNDRPLFDELLSFQLSMMLLHSVNWASCRQFFYSILRLLASILRYLSLCVQKVLKNCYCHTCINTFYCRHFFFHTGFDKMDLSHTKPGS